MYETDIQRYIMHQSQNKKVMHQKNQHEVKMSQYFRCAELSSEAEQKTSWCRVDNGDRVNYGCRAESNIRCAELC